MRHLQLGSVDGVGGAGHALAIDIGGTKLAAAVVDVDGCIGWRHMVPTPMTKEPEELFAAVAALVGLAPSGSPTVCGVGCGGPMAPGGEQVTPLAIPAWRDFPLRSRLESLVGVPTFVDNDAKALALAEGWQGSAKGCDNYIAMVVSTGVGGGIVLGGSLLDGASGNAGHIGHVIVRPDGRRCDCGGQGCLEAEASGRAIAALTGRPAAEADRETIERTGRLVGRALASVANLLDLRLAVAAGSVALGFGAPFFAAAQAELDARARLAYSAGTVLMPSALGVDGPLVGAAAIGWRGLGRRSR